MFRICLAIQSGRRKGGKKKEIRNREIDSGFPPAFHFFRADQSEQLQVSQKRVYDSNNASTERNGMDHGEAGWWKEQFRNADVDQNGLLNFTEFKE